MSLKTKIYKALVSFLFLISITPLISQNFIYQTKNIGFNVGLNCAFGTHFQRLGLNFNFFYVNQSFQANTEARVYFSFKNLGPAFFYKELVISQGVLYSYGKPQNYYNPFLNAVSNQTGLKNTLAYAYNIYFNKVKTGQVTGTVAFQFNAITLIVENDILAKPLLDRYRTGAFLIQYQYNSVFQTALNCTMWTGQMGKTTEINHPQFYSNCYIDTTGGMYTKFSNGLLSAQVKYNLGYSQIAQVNVGADAEQIRNVVQNKFIHDMKFVPKKLNKAKNCHIPMIDENGEQYLFNEEQKIRKVKLYLNLFSNPALFY